MSKILAIDLGKFKSVTCLLDTETNAFTVAVVAGQFRNFSDNYNAGPEVLEGMHQRALFLRPGRC